MSYGGRLKITVTRNYSNDVYFQEDGGGNPPPSPPVRFLLQENGQNILQENGNKIELELSTPE